MYNQEYYREHKQKYLDSNLKYKRKVRQAVLEHYGNKCSCCGEIRKEFLSIDHINNDGKQQRTRFNIKTPHELCVWIIKNNFPNDIGILCFNCNLAKGFGGYCPHEKETR